ncbi:Gp49 family protein [Breoghania sp.]|uniref:Gp49 family protein n=1 Tax=Breoghania sp. TaxID=2065378 RepID=UPI002AA73ABC|nr:Gp49 family protein [Breoghania sp.]
MKSDEAIEAEIVKKGKTAPRITLAHIEATIESTHYFSAMNGVDATLNGEGVASLGDTSRQSLELLTFCVIVLKNGFTVTGESACASPENFDPEIGKTIALRKAMEKIWPLEGYLLRQRLIEEK